MLCIANQHLPLLYLLLQAWRPPPPNPTVPSNKYNWRAGRILPMPWCYLSHHHSWRAVTFPHHQRPFSMSFTEHYTGTILSLQQVIRTASLKYFTSSLHFSYLWMTSNYVGLPFRCCWCRFPGLKHHISAKILPLCCQLLDTSKYLHVGVWMTFSCPCERRNAQ